MHQFQLFRIYSLIDETCNLFYSLEKIRSFMIWIFEEISKTLFKFLAPFSRPRFGAGSLVRYHPQNHYRRNFSKHFLKFRIFHFNILIFWNKLYLIVTIFLELNFCKYLESVISGVEWHINEWNKNQIFKPLIIYSIYFRISWITEGNITWFWDNLFIAPPTCSTT